MAWGRLMGANSSTLSSEDLVDLAKQTKCIINIINFSLKETIESME